MTDLDPFQGRPDREFNALPGWSWVGCYGGYYLQCNRLQASGIEHGFFTRLWHGRGPDELAGAISAGISVHRPQQTHSGNMLEAHEATAAPWPEGDGLVSSAGGQSLWVCGADCTPVLLADPRSGHVAACHAGWRGVAAQILPSAIEKLEHRGALRRDLIVALGPAISGPRYQVKGEVISAISNSLGHGDDWTVLEATGVLLADPDPDHHRLDIRAAAQQQLLQAGLNNNQIHICPLCTATETELFHSWRRDQVKTVQWSGIVSQAAIN